MKKRIIAIAAAVIAVVVIIGLGTSLFVTQQNEYKLVRQFGKVNRIIDEAGIYLKVPFLETADSLPKETLLYDLTPSDVITKDKKTMICDSYILWHISDPLKFAQTLNSSVSNAENRLDTIVYNSTKNVISSILEDSLFVIVP